MKVENLIDLGRLWFSAVYCLKDGNRNSAVVSTITNYINSYLGGVRCGSNETIMLRSGCWATNWREPLVVMGGKVCRYQSLANKLRDCPVDDAIRFLRGECDIDDLGRSDCRQRSYIQLLAVIVCVAEVGRGMFQSPDKLLELLEQEGRWDKALLRFSPVLTSRLDDSRDWSDDMKLSGKWNWN